MVGHVFRPDACPDTPPHINEFDPSYLRDYTEDVVEKRAIDTRQHQVINYMCMQKMVEEAREDNPYVVAKDLGVDYRFWNVFHSNFYTSVIFNSKKSKIVKMQYIDWEELRAKNDPDFNRAIKACGNFGLTDIMAFRYN